jgi:predicted AAA+ superfamily ATPase
MAEKSDRKPLVLRGARQVGKTTSVEIFSKDFDQYIYLNLEKQEERILFENNYSFNDLLMTIFLHSGKTRKKGKTLIFIDEIQNSSKAIALLRYFYEEAKDLYVITAGSLLESILDRNISFPVGRVEYMVLHPCSFREFLGAMGETESMNLLEADVVPEYGHDHLTSLFKIYTTIGGMPQVVSKYAENHDLTMLQSIYDSLIISYQEDVEKYANGSSQLQYVRHVLSSVFTEAGSRITFEKFGHSLYRSREIKEAFIVLERAMLLKLVYPASSVQLPMIPNLRKRPRLQLIDTGIVNYATGLMGELVFTQNINDVYRGKIAEHIVGQEFLTTSYLASNKLQFWVRDKNESDAEVDYILPWKEFLVPIEVKSGSIGKLRSLQQFMELSMCPVAVRVWQGKQSIEKVKTLAGKEFSLINMPFYLAHRLSKELNRLIK